MKDRDVLDVYNALIKQIAGKIGKKTSIVYPYGSKNIIVQEFEVTQEKYDRFVSRRDYLLGGF
jgi:hypothetical protein